ncbi:MAG: hypothetical protein RLZZ511_3707 [Cyanobacteriota bacterium]|jgi:hypothetical protein
MLKLTYTETGLELERVNASVETVVKRRTILALRLGHPICVQPGRASFLVPIKGLDLRQFKAMIKAESSQPIELCKVDHDCYEMSLRGTWIANSHEAHEGMFVATMSEAMEQYVEQVWMAVSATLSCQR